MTFCGLDFSRFVSFAVRVPMQVFVREHCTMIATPVHCDVDGIPNGSHYITGRPDETQDQRTREPSPAGLARDNIMLFGFAGSFLSSS
jgi:hypothetical protein